MIVGLANSIARLGVKFRKNISPRKTPAKLLAKASVTEPIAGWVRPLRVPCFALGRGPLITYVR